MRMKRSIEGGITILEVGGTVRVGESAQQFAAELEDILAGDTQGVLIDVSGIDYVDSTGIGELVGFMQKFSRADRRFALLRPQARLSSLLELTGLDRLFAIFTDREQALQHLAGAPR
jgi:anti-sigma B factor antagonist